MDNNSQVIWITDCWGILELTNGLWCLCFGNDEFYAMLVCHKTREDATEDARKSAGIYN